MSTRRERAKEPTAKQNKQLADLECNDMGTILFMIAIAAITLGFFFWTDKRESQTKQFDTYNERHSQKI